MCNVGFKLPHCSNSCKSAEADKVGGVGCGKFKLNMEGGSCGNLGMSGGGGIIRDS